jgi:cell division protein FtsB
MKGTRLSSQIWPKKKEQKEVKELQKQEKTMSQEIELLEEEIVGLKKSAI